MQVFLARQGPGDGLSSGLYYLLEGETLEPPESVPEANSNVEAVSNLLDARLGIAPNQHTPPEGQTRSPVSATLRHALTLSFQEQEDIASKRRLFHA